VRAAAAGAAWRSYHLFYHGDRDRLLLELVRPLVSTLLADDDIDSFFFVRFALGGPHVRLRLRSLPARAETAAARVADRAAAFFARRPSLNPLDGEAIRRRNRLILARAPHERDDAVYPDNALRELPFRPEIDRYGGPQLLDFSLDFSALSSVAALRFLAAHGAEPRQQQIPVIFRLLVRQALGLARSCEELAILLRAPVESWGDSMAPAVARADQVFARRGQDLLRLLRTEIELLSAAPETEAARRLAWEVRGAPEDRRRRIAESHLHMTANRLGIEGAEEVYLARLLWRSAQALAASLPEAWKSLGEALSQAEPHGCLHDLLAPAFGDLKKGGDLSPP
jgi:hypothetical protein